MPSFLKDLKSGECRIELELDEREAAAIGRVTANWAYLEHVIYSVTAGISEFVGVDIPTDALNFSFSRRLSALRTLVENHAIETERRSMERLIGQITNVEQDRHKITHGLWDWDPANPDRLLASSFRPRASFEKKFDYDRIIQLGDRIARISFELRYPGGWDEAWADRLGDPDADGNVRFLAVSRHFARLMAKKSADCPPPTAATPPDLPR